MKIVYSFTTQNRWALPPNRYTAGWSSSLHHYFSWALSSSIARQHYDQVELHTDDAGAAFLGDVLQLPFTRILTSLQGAALRPGIWSQAKTLTYARQDEPFIHVDSDVFLWNRLPAKIEAAGVVAQSAESRSNYDFVNAYDKLRAFLVESVDAQQLPERFVNPLDLDHAWNMGIFGGRDLQAIQFYADQVNRLVAADWSKIPSYVARSMALNIVVEQLTAAASMLQQGVRVAPLFGLGTPEQLGFTHAMGLKRDLQPGGFCDRMQNRVRVGYPDLYARIMANVVPWTFTKPPPPTDVAASLISFRMPICDQCPHELIEDGVKKCALQRARSAFKAGYLLHDLGLPNPDAQCPDSPPRWRRIKLHVR